MDDPNRIHMGAPRWSQYGSPLAVKVMENELKRHPKLKPDPSPELKRKRFRKNGMDPTRCNTPDAELEAHPSVRGLPPVLPLRTNGVRP